MAKLWFGLNLGPKHFETVKWILFHVVHQYIMLNSHCADQLTYVVLLVVQIHVTFPIIYITAIWLASLAFL